MKTLKELRTFMETPGNYLVVDFYGWNGLGYAYTSDETIGEDCDVTMRTVHKFLETTLHTKLEQQRLGDTKFKYIAK